MECPKCGFEQQPARECLSCGWVLERPDSRPRAGDRFSGQARERKSVPLILPLLGLVVVIFVGLLWFSSGNKETPPSVSASLESSGDHDGELFEAVAELVVPPGTLDLRKQLKEGAPAGNEVERARNATLFLETAWGSGSGFFVSSDCQIVTNRHVVEFDRELLGILLARMDRAAQAMESEARQLGQLRDYFYDSCRDCSKEAYRRFLGSREALLDRAYENLSTADNDLQDLRDGTVEVSAVLADGSEHKVQIESISEEYDLAFLRLESAACPFLESVPDLRLNQGDTLYTIGSPRGLRHTVTSGIYSGIMEEEGIKWIQTDAPINPGNSGGPLIDKKGRVVGVNTMILDDSEGIGFALPISTVMDELGK